MKPLREKFCEFIQLRNLAETTRESYLQAVVKLSKHYNESPERIGQEKIFPLDKLSTDVVDSFALPSADEKEEDND